MGPALASLPSLSWPFAPERGSEFCTPTPEALPPSGSAPATLSFFSTRLWGLLWLWRKCHPCAGPPDPSQVHWLSVLTSRVGPTRLLRRLPRQLAAVSRRLSASACARRGEGRGGRGAGREPVIPDGGTCVGDIETSRGQKRIAGTPVLKVTMMVVSWAPGPAKQVLPIVAAPPGVCPLWGVSGLGGV